MSGMYLGSTISLISKSDIRYVGVLHSINQAESTVSLGQVKSHGTEGRRSGLDEIPANDKIFEYIVFRGSDIKDLHVVTAPVQAQSQVPNDPAILTTQPPPSEQGQPSYFNNSNLPLPHNTMSQPYLPPGMNNYMLQQAQQQQAMFFQQQQQNFWQQQQQQQHSNNAVPAFSAQQTLPTQNASQQQAPNSTSPTSTPIKTENLEEGSTEKLNNDLMKLNLNSSSKKSTTGSTFVTENNLVVKKEKKNVESTTNPRSASPAYKNVTAEDSFGQSGIDNEKPPAGEIE
ncbi:hypothetical protein HK099_004767 [Clydaea vesicula]|uniref:Sm domain-containing protein n=1 Tax=Clydaea vesicula TaxID=447962 RepID=A0AAD5U0A7_9FUNG|nr:hypothetical protein HK099_004767 [Clydaea vesicula]